MSIRISWKDTEEPEIDIDLMVMVDREGARQLRDYLAGHSFINEADIINSYLNSIAEWRHKNGKG